ncbi:MAG: DUF1992 domain-containing protein [Actinocatenispora sp.]
MSRRESYYESVVDEQIRLAQERGEFDNLPGAGKPLPGLGRSSDDLWWIKDYIAREGLSGEALLPPSLQLRKEVERLPETVRGLPSEQAVRELVAALNRRIVDWMRAPSGPAVRVGPVNTESVVAGWHEHRRSVASRPVVTPADPPPAPPAPRTSWWRRFGRRRHPDPTEV